MLPVSRSPDTPSPLRSLTVAAPPSAPKTALPPPPPSCRLFSTNGGPMPAAQDELLAKAMDGDPRALADLLTRDGSVARGAPHDAIPAKWQSVLSMDDVMQQTYAEAVVSIGRFENRGQGS